MHGNKGSGFLGRLEEKSKTSRQLGNHMDERGSTQEGY